MSKITIIKVLVSMLCVILVFHFLVITGHIPYDKVWAGRLTSQEEMLRFELFSIILNVFIIGVLIKKYKFIKKERTNKVVDVLIWFFAVFFCLNTLGNLFARSLIELIFGTLFTLTLCVLCVLLVIKK